MIEWFAFNAPFFTDKEPYCNTIRFITKDDAIAFWRRTHPKENVTNLEALGNFITVNWAWPVSRPDITLKKSTP